MNNDPSSWKEWKHDVKRDRNIWEFQRGYKVNEAGRHETAEQFRTFQFFLNNPGNRTIAAIAELAEKNENQISIWSKKFKWDRRAAAWDKKQLSITFKEATNIERRRQRESIEEYRKANEDQAKMMMEVSGDLMHIIQKRLLKAESEGENIPLGLVSGLMRAAANISDSGRQSWATALGVGQLMEVVDTELEEVQVQVLEESEDEAYEIPLDEE